MTEKLRNLYDKIYDISDNFKSHKSAITGFEGFPDEYKFIYAIDYVDSDIKNGGIYQLYQNSTWHLILDAIEGAKSFGLHMLSENLKAILFYYYKNEKSKMKKRIPESYFDKFPDTWNKNLDDLEDEYYSVFDALKIKSTTKLWESLIENGKIKC